MKENVNKKTEKDQYFVRVRASQKNIPTQCA